MRRQLFGIGKVVRQAIGQCLAIQRHNALIALSLPRIDGQRQRAIAAAIGSGDPDAAAAAMTAALEYGRRVIETMVGPLSH